ncbi:MAG TPA: multiheme c-type cytochrome [Bryobacteraceae bacterium]|nr:multiheme c-type cytochrome [Bryobacteraceae bacterium]
MLPASVFAAGLCFQVAVAQNENKAPSSCEACHAQQAMAQPKTAMARALRFASSDPLFQTSHDLTFQKGKFTYKIARENDGKVLYSVTDGADTLSVPVQYVMGAGSRTFVIEHHGALYESLVSYFPRIDGLDTTIGDQDVDPRSLTEAMGRELTRHESTACFGCHATGAVSGQQLRLTSFFPGVTCAHCHAGAGEHVAALTSGKPGITPPKLNRLSSEEISTLCGQCHRTWETVVRNRWRGPINVRFQPYRLANSRCFDGVDSRMSCIACHDPHQEVVHEEKAYDSKCLACHSASAKPSAGMLARHTDLPASKVIMTSCPIGKEKCVSCHMPKVDLPGAHLTFADHDIRVVHPGESYPN